MCNQGQPSRPPDWIHQRLRSPCLGLRRLTSPHRRYQVQPNVVWIGNQKGGVGKTTLTAQLGGLLSAAGWRVLLVDLDPQGNLARHPGVISKSDEGRNLFAAVTDRVPLEPLPDVRPGLDLVPAGEHWSYALGRLSDLTASGRGLEPAVGAIA